MIRNRYATAARTGLLSILITGALAAMVLAHPGAQHRVEIKLRGTIESIDNDRWVVAGHEFSVMRSTDIEDYVRVGDYVRVEADEDANGKWIATEIDRKRQPWRPRMSIEYRLRGSIEVMKGDTWTVAGREFRLTPRTSVEDSVFVGSLVKVDAYEDSNGNLVATDVDSENDRR